MQEAFVYMIIVVAAGWVVFWGVKKWKHSDERKCSDGCSGCPLKDKCTDPKSPADKNTSFQ